MRQKNIQESSRIINIQYAIECHRLKTRDIPRSMRNTYNRGLSLKPCLEKVIEGGKDVSEYNR